MPFIKNIDPARVYKIAELAEYLSGQIVSKTLSQNSAHSLTLFAFDKNEEISTHASDGDAMIIALDGAGRITIDGEVFTLTAGETIVMPAGKPHAVFAQERFKMLLIVMFS
ncbi:MAG: cupin domain-containing protein [Clostridiales bacterium]|nr:cupin domain-containing protein [Clostridiales bacterium]